jgi:hypothetical protein
LLAYDERTAARTACTTDGRRTTGHQRPAPTTDPSLSAHEQSVPPSLRQQFGEWINGCVNADPLAPPADVHSEGAAVRSDSPACSAQSTATTDPAPPTRRYRQRSRIAPDDTLYNLTCQLRHKEITIRLTPDGSILFETDDAIPYHPPQSVTQLKFQPPPINPPLCEEEVAYATEISFIAT